MAAGKDRQVDALKLIGLLWREPYTERGPRSGASTSSVTALAVHIADREGIEAVTLRRIAQEASVTAMALYPHIGGRLELIELMLDQVAADVYDRVAIPEAPDWRTRIEAIAEANWKNCLRHPWITEHAPGRSVPGPGSSTKYEIELQALDDIGLSDVEMEHTLTALITFVNGIARATLANRRSRDQSGRDDVQWWQQIEPTLSTFVRYRQKFPIAVRVSRTLGDTTGKANDPESVYRFGLSLLLDGLAARREKPKL